MARCNDFFISVESARPDITGYNLILPCVSVGNVAQLAIDLLINSLKLQLLGWINEDAVLPVVGNDAFAHTGATGNLHTSSELYVNHEDKVVFLQLRSPLAKGQSGQFIKKLLQWVTENTINQIVVLTSSYADERRDKDILSSPFRFVLNSNAADLFHLLTSEHHWIPLEPRQDLSDNSGNPVNGVLDTNSLFLPGSGFAKQIYSKRLCGMGFGPDEHTMHTSMLINKLCGMGFGPDEHTMHTSMLINNETRLVLLVMFCSQGDNIPDAVSMATHLNEWLNLVNKENKSKTSWWSLPNSWSQMYGGSHPRTLY